MGWRWNLMLIDRFGVSRWVSSEVSGLEGVW